MNRKDLDEYFNNLEQKLDLMIGSIDLDIERTQREIERKMKNINMTIMKERHGGRFSGKEYTYDGRDPGPTVQDMDSELFISRSSDFIHIFSRVLLSVVLLLAFIFGWLTYSYISEQHKNKIKPLTPSTQTETPLKASDAQSSGLKKKL
jgi:hypothetical protein